MAKQEIVTKVRRESKQTHQTKSKASKPIQISIVAFITIHSMIEGE